MYRLFQKLTCKGTNTADNSFHRRQKGYQRVDRAVHFTGLGECVYKKTACQSLRYGCETCVLRYWWLPLESNHPVKTLAHTLPYLSFFLIGNITLTLLKGQKTLQKKQPNWIRLKRIVWESLCWRSVNTCFDCLLSNWSSVLFFSALSHCKLIVYDWCGNDRRVL